MDEELRKYQGHPETLLSISDDDLCSRCKFCQYDVGNESSCLNGWPALFNLDDYARTCEQYQKIDYPEQNWV